jgi:hypothetical protein
LEEGEKRGTYAVDACCICCENNQKSTGVLWDRRERGVDEMGCEVMQCAHVKGGKRVEGKEAELRRGEWMGVVQRKRVWAVRKM